MVNSTLVKLTIRYFKRRGYQLKRDAIHEGFSGVSRKFDLLVRLGGRLHPVWIRDWRRTVGVNVVINIDKASEDAGLSNPILVAEKFSDHAKAYANRRGIKLITASEIRRSLRY